MAAPAAPPEPAWTGLVLAGGRSSRMGRDKAMLPWRGRPLLQHMIELLAEAGATTVLVSGDYPAYAGIADTLPGRGPLAGLSSAAAQLDDGPLLVVPVDMPCLSPSLLRRLISAPAAPGVCFEGQVLPLRLQLDARSRACLAQLLSCGAAQRSLRALQSTLGFHSLPAPAQLLPGLRNCNTPGQWQELAV
ncbi:molybdenum cofactor guanylyltransferase [Stenotrophomonas sp. YIM B06876]|uniref:molybdenum cofactor guanylyltransferase n=1 Tax=Stenotrophomonas sp. YIM B06876 TaxID=3060211 RepID=UPI002738B6B1|nr:molybdenum cofactor guanylyltransferase [Stenotrophomonas sp. YIM B06876]